MLSGDFRQVLPVVPRASRAGIVRACLKRSALWPLFETHRLSENMRVLANGNDERLCDWDKRLLLLGDGAQPTINDTDVVQLQEEMCHTIDETSAEALDRSREEAINFAFPNLASNSQGDAGRTWLAERGILAPKNDVVDEINETCMRILPGEADVFRSADSIVHDDQVTSFPTEFLNSMRASGMAPHRLELKKGCILMLLRNLSKRNGLCNGTRLIYLGKQGNFLLRCKVANGDGNQDEVLIPRIIMRPSDMRGQPCEWQRQQFPVRLAFAMTINKSQGQTLKRASVWLQSPVFGHGQLYVAASRIGHPDGIKFFITQAAGTPEFATRNVVFREVLRDADS